MEELEWVKVDICFTLTSQTFGFLQNFHSSRVVWEEDPMARYSLIFKMSILLLLVFMLSACTSCTLTPIEVGCYNNELIEAINTANASPNPDVINLEADCLYTFHEIDNNVDLYGTSHEDGGNALPVISTHITINGNGARLIRATASGTPEFRFFAVTTDGDLTLNDLSLENGELLWSYQIRGGAIYIKEGSVTINNSILRDTSTGYGAIYNDNGTLFIEGSSLFSNNTAEHYGGAIYNTGILSIDGTHNMQGGVLTVNGSRFEQNTAGMYGGAVYSTGRDFPAELTIHGAAFEANTSTRGGGAVSAEYAHDSFEIMGSSFNSNHGGLGGAIETRETGNLAASIEESVFENNTAASGGAIFTWENAPIAVSNCVFYDNSVINDGGAIFVYSPLNINTSHIHANTAGGYGGGVFSYSPALILEGVLLEVNTADMWGGAIMVEDGNLTMTDSTIRWNHAFKGGGLYTREGTVTIVDSTEFKGNTAQETGGGIYNRGVLTLRDSTIINNEAVPMGGGIDNDGEMEIETSTIDGNSAANGGGGIKNFGVLEVSKSTISNNTGGGIRHGGSLLTLTNTTVSGNVSDGNPAGMSMNGDTIIIHSTIANNNNASAGGQGGLNVFSGAVLQIKNSIVANNSPRDCHGGETAIGENLDSDGTCTGFTLTDDPLLGPLANNGGPTETHALLPGSPAIDAATDCDDLSSPPILVTSDQRGEGRPEGAQCDLGAYEVVYPLPPPPPPPPLPPFSLKMKVNLNCRLGPDKSHMVMHTFLAGETTNAIGRNNDASWFAIADPEGEPDIVWCWLPEVYVEWDADPFVLPIEEGLPPWVEPKPKPTKCIGAGCP